MKKRSPTLVLLSITTSAINPLDKLDRLFTSGYVTSSCQITELHETWWNILTLPLRERVIESPYPSPSPFPQYPPLSLPPSTFYQHPLLPVSQYPSLPPSSPSPFFLNIPILFPLSLLPFLPNIPLPFPSLPPFPLRRPWMTYLWRHSRAPSRPGPSHGRLAGAVTLCHAPTSPGGEKKEG